MQRTIFEQLGKRVLARHIGHVCRHPYWYIAVPFLVVLALVPGNFLMDYKSDHFFLAGMPGRRASKEKADVEKLFPNSSTIGRETGPERYGRIIISLRNNDENSSLLDSPNALKEIIRLDRFVRQNISICHQGESVKYDQLCSQHLHGCFQNPAVKLARVRRSRVKYPFERDQSGEIIVYRAALGGVTLDRDGYVVKTSAVQLHYLLRTDTPKFLEQGIVWEKEFVSVVSALSFSSIKIDLYASHLLQKEFDETSNSVIPKIWVSVILLTVFGIFAFYQKDCTRSKITVGMVAITSTTMAAIAAFGLCIIFEVPYIPMNLVIPFVLLGIGMDDTLVILSVWWSTPGKTVEERLLKTFDHCGMSITITSITNIISFVIGIAAPFVYVHIFCIYTVVAMLFLYILQMTFLTGFLVLAARHEMEGVNNLWFLPVINKEKGEAPKNVFQKYLLTTEGNQEIGVSSSFTTTIFSEYLGPFLVKTRGRAIVLFSLFVYLGLAGYGLTQISVAPKFDKIFKDNSYSSHFIKAEEKYFHFHSYRIQVFIKVEIDYSDIGVRSELERLVARLESSPHIDSNYTEFWLPAYLEFLNISETNISFSNSEDERKERFIFFLRQKFLKIPSGWDYTHDIAFNGEGTAIAHSRFYIQSTDVINESDLEDMFSHLNDAVDSSPLDLGYHNAKFYLLEHNLFIIPFALISISSISVAILLVLFVFVPNLKVIILTTTILVFIELGVVGFLTYMDMLFDLAALVGIIMCIGFSVDSCIHLTYSFLNSKELTSDLKIRESLGVVGFALVKTAFSCVLCNLSLYFIPSYFSRTIFKMTMIIMISSTYQSLIVLPTLYGIFYDLGCSKKYSLEHESSPMSAKSGCIENACEIKKEKDGMNDETIGNVHQNNTGEGAIKMELGCNVAFASDKTF